jgi:fructan beta-fructosidase
MMTFNEAYHPKYHFTPPEKWMNDPNGLVYYKGEYHLFYQYNPVDIVWGPVHWGHAVSKDLVNWQHMPIALYPDEIGAIYSGSVVIDLRDTAGFGNEAMVAIFTHHASGKERQSLAYSNDGGRSWSKYDRNPVIDAPDNLMDFRDPKVFWYEKEDGDGHWVMAVAGGNAILFYTSPNLRDWEPVSSFGYGATCGVWEMPDLFKLCIDGSLSTRWVLAVSVGGCAPAGGSGIQYFIGNFDGETFMSENSSDEVLWVDYGADFYAAQSWNQEPNGRSVWVGWMNNWVYAEKTPTATWRGAFSIPRQLGLVTTPEGIRLTQKPITEMENLRAIRYSWRGEALSPGVNLLAEIRGETLEIIAEFQVEREMDADHFGIRVRSGENEATTIGYDVKAQTLFVDRARSGQTSFSLEFPAIHIAEMKPLGGAIRLHIFVDCASVEVFGNNGLVVFSEQIFPGAESIGLETFVDGGKVLLSSMDVYKLNAAAFWPANAKNQ